MALTLPLIEQIKQRRKALKLTQQDMQFRIGMTRQQYQRLESAGNPRLSTLMLVAEGVNAELMLIPREKCDAIRELLTASGPGIEPPSADEDPWRGLLGDGGDEK
ncbi:helix-turn-helix transcriptional regulator [Salinicola rhizosphaerae]|uniref:HTH cro/C1-type domain-containing protein n=1 Tax=Salinicola rhizosphaerae TaxID=1443141 RepID=A0ABQ3DLP0_9GAMM|nr:helix-turn-helix transcriptional regulator [Salinicola rhizosphaerae]GHB07018.1 hypothetical protein GCM10009038_00240 [Salinicola rhizosphaerae]